MKKGFFAGSNVLIMGLGRFGGGVDVTKFACHAGAEVIVTDLAPSEKLTDSLLQLKDCPDIKFHLGSHSKPDFQWADIIIVNPAVPDKNEFLDFARKLNKFVTSQVNIFFELCPATIIAITGANGKSTTSALTAHLLKNTRHENVWLSGNIGNQPLLTVIDQINKTDLVVLEISSFQAQQLALSQKAPHIALLTNLTPNHLDRHHTFENYCRAKENIFKFQKPDSSGRKPVSIFNAQDKIAAQWYEKYKIDDSRICMKFSTEDVTSDIRQIFPLPGNFNLSNLAAALCVAGFFGVKNEQIKKSLQQFKALAHRLELVAEINGVKWYNDSIATTPQSTIAALQAFSEPKIIIAGGYDKNLPFDDLGIQIAKTAKAAILIGQTAPKIKNAVSACPHTKTRIEITDSLAKAVDLAAKIAAEGDVVLLSPACASYNMFDNFQHRGMEFIRLVMELNPQL